MFSITLAQDQHKQWRTPSQHYYNPYPEKITAPKYKKTSQRDMFVCSLCWAICENNDVFYKWGSILAPNQALLFYKIYMKILWELILHSQQAPENTKISNQ